MMRFGRRSKFCLAESCSATRLLVASPSDLELRLGGEPVTLSETDLIQSLVCGINMVFRSYPSGLISSGLLTLYPLRSSNFYSTTATSKQRGPLPRKFRPRGKLSLPVARPFLRSMSKKTKMRPTDNVGSPFL